MRERASAEVELELLTAGDRVGVRDQLGVSQADANPPEREDGEWLDVLGRFAGVLVAQLCIEFAQPRRGLSEDRLPAADIHVEHHVSSIARSSAIGVCSDTADFDPSNPTLEADPV
jgi:hypothetical protein